MAAAHSLGQVSWWRWLLALLAAITAVAILALLLVLSQNVDSAQHLRRLENIREVDRADARLLRAFTRERTTQALGDEDDPTISATRLGEALEPLENGADALAGLAPMVDLALHDLREVVERRLELTHEAGMRSLMLSQRLVSGVQRVNALALRLAPQGDESAADLPEQLRDQATLFALATVPVNGEELLRLKNELVSALPAEQTAPLLEAVDDLVADKGEIVDKRREFLALPGTQKLRALEQAYLAWHGARIAEAARYRSLLAGYAALLLLVLAWLGLRLRRSYRELDEANDHLEEQVERRTHDLSQALNDLRQSQAQLIQSEKMASLGQMVAGVAHEINTPLGYARSNADTVRGWLARIAEILGRQRHALSLLASGQASETEIAAALAEAEERGAAFDTPELLENLDSLLQDTDHGLSQIAELVSSLKDFSRLDRSRQDLFDVNAGLDAALKICSNQIKHRVEVVKQYGRLPQIECAPSQLNQVFLNLFTNAAQAIEGQGKLFIHSSAEAEGVAVRIIDTGCGMSEEVRQHIFEPFFTTKPVGSGTGLGLSIVFRIVQDHGGRIDVRSMPGKGSEFTLWLPLRQARTVARPDPLPSAA